MRLKERVEQEAARRLSVLKGGSIFRASPAGYTKHPELNLIAGVTRNDFWADLSSGDGGELVDSPKGPAKFCAAHSSSALAANSFGPFRRHPDRLALQSHSPFTKAQFERKCPTGLRGNAPNLDFVAESHAVVVGVESKFLEPLSSEKADFADSYSQLVDDESDQAWRRAYDELKSAPTVFSHLHAAQLVKHSLGLRHSFPNVQAVTLLYIYWESMNASEHCEFEAHREEIEEFAGWVRGGDIRFAALAYPDLWRQWDRELTWSGSRAHLLALRERYEFKV